MSLPNNAQPLPANKTQPNQWKLLTFLLLISSSIVLSIHAYLGSYARPMADDFCSFYFARRLSMLRYVWYWYLNWGGRYSAIATDSLIEQIGVTGLRYVPLVMLVLWVMAASFTSYALLRNRMDNGQRTLQALALGATFVFATLAVSPQSGHILYWWNGMRTYLPALVGATFHAGFLLWVFDHVTTRQAIAAASLISVLLALFSGGYNETFAAIQFACFAGFILLGLLTRKLHTSDPSFLPLFAGLLGSTVALLIMLLAPGTANRESFFPTHPTIGATLQTGWSGYLGYLAQIVGAPEKILAWIAATLAAVWAGSLRSRTPSPGYWSLLPMLVGAVLSFVSVLPAIYGTSEMPAPRTLIVASFLLVLGSVYTGFLFGQGLHDRKGTFVSTALMICLGLSILLSAALNARVLYNSRGTYIEFAQRWDQTDAQIKQARSNGSASVSIAAPRNWAGLEEPNDNPRYWVTACYSRYYDFPVFGPVSE